MIGELSLSNNSLKKIFNYSADSIFLIDKKKMKFLDVNRTACDSTGYTHEELLRMGPHEIKPEYSKEDLYEIFDSVLLLNRNPKVISTIHKRKDGSTFPVEVFLTNASRDGIIIASARDVSYRKNIERKLEESEKKFQIIFDNLKDNVFVHPIQSNNQPGHFVLTNKSATESLGYTQEEFRLMGPLSLDDQEISDRYIPIIMKHLQKTGEAFFEAVHVSKHGEKIPVEIHSHVIEFNDKPHVISIARDITKRKELERKKDKYQQMLTSTLEAVDSLLIVIDKKYRIVLSNWKDHEWVSEQERDTRPLCYKALKRLDEPCHQCPAMKTFNDGKPRWYESQNPFDNRYKEVSIIPIFNKKGTVEYILEHVKDVTKLKKNEKELIELNSKLEKRVEEKTDSLKKSKERLKQVNKYLSDLINSSNDIIIAFDEFKNLMIWNKTIEQITGIKGNHIRGRNLSKIEMIESKEKINDYVENGGMNEKTELIIKTSSGERRIIQCSCTQIKKNNKKKGGLLIVGQDITDLKKIISQLIPGNSYLITPECMNLSNRLINDLTSSGYNIFSVSRGKVNIPSRGNTSDIVRYEWGEEKKEERTIQTIESLYDKLTIYLKDNEKSLIYLNRIDYILINEKFNDIMKMLYKINNLISDTNSYLFIEIDPRLLTEKEIEYLRKEFSDIPFQSAESCNLLPDEMEILEYIYKNNQKNVLVSYKDIGKKFSYVSQTTSNKLKKLENKGVINIIKNGKRKNLFCSERGKLIILQG